MAAEWTINGVTIRPQDGELSYELDDIPSDTPGVYSTGNTGRRGKVVHVEKRALDGTDPWLKFLDVVSSVNTIVDAIIAQQAGDYAVIVSPFFTINARIKIARPRFPEAAFTPLCWLEIDYEEILGVGAGEFAFAAWTINGVTLTPLDGPVQFGLADIGQSMPVVPTGIAGRSNGNTGYRGTIVHREKGSASNKAEADTAMAAIEASIAAKVSAIMGDSVDDYATVTSPYFTIRARITNAQPTFRIEKPFTPVGELAVSYEQVSI